MTSLASTELRHQLEEQLTLIFRNNTISKYLVIDDHGPELQIIGNSLAIFPQISSAFRVWTTMAVNDRHRVLSKFYQLYTGLPIQGHGKRKTLVFCALFIHEFAAILANTTLYRCSAELSNDIQQNQSSIQYLNN